MVPQALCNIVLNQYRSQDIVELPVIEKCVNLCETADQSEKNQWDMLKQSFKKPSIWFPKHLN